MAGLLSRVEMCPDCGLLCEDNPNNIRVFVDYEKGDVDIVFECDDCGFSWYLHHQEEVWDGTYVPDEDDGEDEGDADSGC